MACTRDLPYLIRLLDDQDPAVEPIVSKEFKSFGGDISHDLAALGISVEGRQRKHLSRLLAFGRRDTLRNEWQVPSGGAMAIAEDWESFENMLRQVSDYLHDGITLRASLSDSIDILAEEANAELVDVSTDELRVWLFEKGSFSGSAKSKTSERDFDLCHVLDKKAGNPIGLAIVYMLVGARLDVQVDACSYPGHFLNRIDIDGEPYLVDPYHKGRKFDIDVLLHEHSGISDRARAAILEPSHLGLVISRFLSELEASFLESRKPQDAQLISELVKTLNR